MNLLDLLFQAAGLAVFAVVIGLGHRRWVARYGAALDTQQRGVLLLIIVTLAGGLVGSPVWWADDPRAFAWDLPPLAGRMLGAAGWSFVALCLAALEYPTRGRIRLALVMLAVYLTPLAIAILIWHRDRFDPGAPITYAFFIIVAGLIVPALWFLIRPPRPIARREDHRPAAPLLSLWLTIVAAVTGLWGLALFVTDRGPTALIWAWPGDLLTSRLIGVMLLTIMAGALQSRRSADLARIVLLATIVYAVGLTVASLWGLLLGQPPRPGYAVAFAAIAIGSTLALASERRAPAPRDAGIAPSE
jgi:hypothetical protein